MCFNHVLLSIQRFQPYAPLHGKQRRMLRQVVNEAFSAILNCPHWHYLCNCVDYNSSHAKFLWPDDFWAIRTCISPVDFCRDVVEPNRCPLFYSPLVQERAWRPSRKAADNQAAHDAAVLSEAQVGSFCLQPLVVLLIASFKLLSSFRLIYCGLILLHNFVQH